jgi:hypothetical protein
MGALGGVASSMGVDAGGLGSLASLAGGFGKLDLSGDMVQKFVAIATKYLTDKGGDAVGNIMKSLTS